MMMTHRMLELWWVLLNSDLALVLPGVLRLGRADRQGASLLRYRHKGSTIQLNYYLMKCFDSKYLAIDY